MSRDSCIARAVVNSHCGDCGTMGALRELAHQHRVLVVDIFDGLVDVREFVHHRLSDALHISMSGPPACPAQLCVPDWPIFNRNKLKWLPPLYKDGEVKEKEA